MKSTTQLLSEHLTLIKGLLQQAEHDAFALHENGGTLDEIELPRDLALRKVYSILNVYKICYGCGHKEQQCACSTCPICGNITNIEHVCEQ